MKKIPGEKWELDVIHAGKRIHRKLLIEPAKNVMVTREKHQSVPFFKEQKWQSGIRFDKLVAWECSLTYALLPDSVRIEDANGTVFQNGLDYYFDVVWGAFGRTPDSQIGESDTVYVSYEYQPYRLDSIVIDCHDTCYQKIGQVNGATPLPPELEPGETLIGNIYFDRNRRQLSDDMLFPLVEEHPASVTTDVAETLLPRTLAKLRAGQPVKILAWGDSVTACNFIHDEKQRWINIFVDELRRRFPSSEITLVNLGWPGKSSNAFQNEPPGSKYNYEENVVNSGADLVTMEFVNDASLTNKADFNRIYNRVRDDFTRQGFEPIIILPHPVRPDWMGLTIQKNIDEDPRPYVKYLRRWATENNFAIADVSSRFLHLWKEGIPYNSLMLNNINHPDARGIKLFAEVLSGLFPPK
jgi:hypothetical protein